MNGQITQITTLGSYVSSRYFPSILFPKPTGISARSICGRLPISISKATVADKVHSLTWVESQLPAFADRTKLVSELLVVTSGYFGDGEITSIETRILKVAATVITVCSSIIFCLFTTVKDTHANVTYINSTVFSFLKLQISGSGHL